MTRTGRRPVSFMADGRSPLLDSMAAAERLGGYFAMPLRRPGATGWTDAADLFLGDDRRLERLVTAYGERAWASSNRHVVNSAFLVAYLSRVVFPAVGQYVLHRRAPEVSLTNLAFHWNGAGIDATGLGRPAFAALADDPATGHRDTLIVADETELYGQLKRWLFEENLDVVVAALCRASGASPKVSQNAVAAAFSQVFNRLYATASDPSDVVRTAGLFFNDAESPIHGQLTMEEFHHRGRTGFFSRRAGCCLWWRSPRSNEYCSNCILLPREEQDRRFRQMLAQPGGGVRFGG